MKTKILAFLILGISAASNCFAQALEPGAGSQSSSTGSWSSVSQEHSDSVGYGSGDHGNVN